MSVWAVVPVRSFRCAKSRLAHIPPPRRAALARGLCEHVLGTLAGHAELAGLVVATDCCEVAQLARRYGADIVRDRELRALAAIVDGALRHVAARGADAALVVMADLPRLAAADVDGLLAGLREADVVVAPDRGRAGTNALALASHTWLPTAFGHDDSFARHLRTAAAHGARVAVCETAGLACDVDLREHVAEHTVVAASHGLSSAYASG
jgi:2-phospho-L-lactate guanylyltransferase